MTEASHKDIERIAKPGEVLAGKYLVERVLGVGGMGAVVAATHTQLEQRVALKFLLPSMMGSREVVERFLREARAAAKIKGEHVVRVSDVGTLEGGVPYIVMELLDGRDLGELLARRGPLPVPLAVDYVLEACEALAEAHAAGIVHRDLKPSNLFLARCADGSEIVKVLDFGISKQLAPEGLGSNPAITKTTDVFGSPTYMSPEQLKASRDVDTRADLWALGVILYELLTGATPFGGGTVAEIFGAILHQPAPRIREARKDIPVELERVLLRCLEKDAGARYQDVAELADALVPFGSDAARTSMARVGRILRSTGNHPRVSVPGSRASSASLEPARVSSPDAAVQGRTGPGGDAPPAGAADDAERAAALGSATATSWGHVRPAGRGTPASRVALVVAGVLVAAVAGAFVAVKLVAPAGSGAAATGGAPIATEAPLADARTAPATPTTPTTVVVPAPSGNIAADPPPATGAPVSTVAATGATAAAGASATSVTGATAPRDTGKTATTGAPASPATAAATTAPAPTPPPATPPPGGDDEFGGRR